MADLRLTLAQSCSVLGACILLIACGSSHGVDDAGADAALGVDGGGTPDSGAVDGGGSGTDAGPRGTCDADDANAEICPEVVCDGPPSWHWDGERCLAIECGACVGEDCAGPSTSSRMDCEAAHATCEPMLCRSTGGTWRWWDPLCGHYICGEPPLSTCEVGAPACDCDYGHNFVAGVGCVEDTDCPEVDPLPTDVLCTSTGGTMQPTCCPTVCGVLCGDACTSPACNCGPMEIFHPIRGCTLGARCLERLPGERCESGARCEGGTLCCDRCGGAGCAGEPTCIAPVCDDDPVIDMCGNNTLAP